MVLPTWPDGLLNGECINQKKGTEGKMVGRLASKENGGGGGCVSASLG